MKHLEFTQKLSLLAQKGIDDGIIYSRRRTVKKKNFLTEPIVVEDKIDKGSIQLKLFEV